MPKRKCYSFLIQEQWKKLDNISSGREEGKYPEMKFEEQGKNKARSLVSPYNL